MEIHEELFFRVFKNKFLFKKIFSNFNQFKSSSYKYKEIISCEWLLKYGYIDLLRTKVKNGEYLTLDFIDSEVEQGRKKIKETDSNNSESFFRSPHYFRKTLFQEINKDESDDGGCDKEFYEILFKNYSIDFQDFSKSVKYMIIDDCLVALKVYCQLNMDNKDFIKYFLSIENMEWAFHYCSFKCLKFIIEMKYRQMGEADESSIKKNLESLFVLSFSSSPEKFVQQIKFFSQPSFNGYNNELDLNVEISGISGIKLPAACLYRRNLSFLFDYCYCLSILSKQFERYIDSLKNKKKQPLFTGAVEQVWSRLNEHKIKVLTIQKLETMDFSKEQLNQIVGDIDSSNSDVKLLYSSVLPFIDPNSRESNLNFCYFYRKYYNSYSIPMHHEYSLDPITFGDPNHQYPYKIYMNWERKTYARIFQYCPNEKEKQLIFIDKIIDEILDSSILEQQKFLPSIFFKMLVEFNNADLVKHYLNRTVGTTSIFNSTWGVVKSIEIFDILVQNSPDSLALKDIFPLKMEFVNHLESNYPDLFEQLLNKDLSGTLWISGGYSKEAIGFMVDHYDSLKVQIIKKGWKHFWNLLDLNQSLSIPDFLKLLRKIESIQKEKENFEIEYEKNQKNESANGSTNNIGGFSASTVYISSGTLASNTTSQNNEPNLSFSNSFTNGPTPQGCYNCFTIFIADSSRISNNFKNFHKAFKAIDTIHKNRYQDIESGKCYIPEKEKYLYNYFKNDFEKSLLLGCNEFMSMNILVLEEIAKRGDTETLSLICISYFRNENCNTTQKNQIYKLMIVASIFGQISIFRFFKLNYPFFFIPNKSTDNPINRISHKTIEDIFDANLVNGHNNIVDYLTLECFPDYKSLESKSNTSLKLFKKCFN